MTIFQTDCSADLGLQNYGLAEYNCTAPGVDGVCSGHKGTDDCTNALFRSGFHFQRVFPLFHGTVVRRNACLLLL